jgi:hypothetical protein
MKTLKFFKHICAIAVIVSSCFVTGCQKEDSLEINNMSYLSITSDFPNLSETDAAVLKEAEDRIDHYIVYENSQYKLLIKKGEQIRISEDLFQMFIDKLDLTNHFIRKLSDCPDILIVQDEKSPKSLHLIGKNQFKTIRLKSGSELPGSGNNIGISWNSSGTDCVYQTIAYMAGQLGCTMSAASVRTHYENSLMLTYGWSQSTAQAFASMGVHSGHVSWLYNEMFTGSTITMATNNMCTGHVSLIYNNHNVYIVNCNYQVGLVISYHCYDPQQSKYYNVSVAAMTSAYKATGCK